MGRSSEFHGGAYGNFEPEPVDLDLSDKVTDHPFYSQPSHYLYHEPDRETSETCMEPGCGRRIHEHKAVYLPPVRGALERIAEAGEQYKQTVREGKERIAKQSYQNDLHMQGHYGIGEHTIQGKGWSDRGPKNLKELKTHLVEDHDLWEEDADEMDDHAAAHARWHANNEFGGETHTHGPPKRHRAED